jgi:hypothetical protein
MIALAAAPCGRGPVNSNARGHTVRRLSVSDVLVGSATLVATVAVAACSEVKSVTGSGRDGGTTTIAMSADAGSVPVNGTTTVRLQLARKNGEPVKDGTRVEVTASLGRVEPGEARTRDGGSASVTYHAGTSPGEARLSATSGEAGTEVVIVVAPAGPAPAAGTTAPPQPTASASAIDLAQVTWLHTDVSSWAETSVITSASIGDPPICIDHTKKGQWPVRDNLEGNPWIFVNLDGRWYAATYEWLRPGQVCKGIHRDNIGDHIGRPPLSTWRPRSGETVGLMVSARARAGGDTVRERSNVVLRTWP